MKTGFVCSALLVFLMNQNLLGATPDSDTINAKIRNAAGKTVLLEPRTYIIDATIAVNIDGTRLSGSRETILKIKDNANLEKMIRISQRNCVIQGIALDGNRSSNACSQATYAIAVENTTGDTFSIRGFVIDGIKITNTKDHGIGIGTNNVHNGKIINCFIENTGGNGILVNPHAYDLSISGNVIGRTLSQNNIFVRGSGMDGASSITITHNICDSAADVGIEVGNTFRGVHDRIIVSDNFITRPVNAGIFFRSVNNGQISNNTIYNAGNTNYGEDGIFITGDFDQNRNVDITANTIVMRDQTFAGNGGAGIHVTAYKDVLASHNSIKSGGTGILLEGETNGIRDLDSVSLKNNTISNAATGIKMGGRNRIRDIFIDSNTIQWVTRGIQCSVHDTSGHASRIIMNRNEIRTCKTVGILLYNTKEAVLSNNVFIDCAFANNHSDDEATAVMLSSCKGIRALNTTVEATESGEHQMKWAFSQRNCAGIEIAGLSIKGASIGAIDTVGKTNPFKKR